MGKDQMGYYKDWVQFQSNKIAEISLFMEIKCTLSNDKPAMKQSKGLIYTDATDATIFNLSEFL